MNRDNPYVGGGSTIDPYFDSERIYNKFSKNKKEERIIDDYSLFDTEDSKIAFIRVMLSTIGKDIQDIDQNFINNIFSEDHFVPKIFEQYAKRNCKKCLGRGFIGWTSNPKFKEKIPLICKCLNLMKGVDNGNKKDR